MACFHRRARALLIALSIVLLSPSAAASSPDDPIDSRTQPHQGHAPRDDDADDDDRFDDGGDDDDDRFDTGDDDDRFDDEGDGGDDPFNSGDDADAEDDNRFDTGDEDRDAGLSFRSDVEPNDPDAPDARVAGCQSEGAQGSPWAISVVLLGFMVLHAAGLLGRRRVR